MTRSEWRDKRHQLYCLLAAMHAGPLGVELVPRIRNLAHELLGLSDLPEVLPPPPADMYRWSYGYCPGNPSIGCSAGSPSDCLPAKLTKLANSTLSRAARRRQQEADYIRQELLPCLETNLQQMEFEGYRSLMALTRTIVMEDVDRISVQGETTSGQGRHREGSAG